MHKKQSARSKNKFFQISCFAVFVLMPVRFLFAQAPILRLTNSFSQQSVLYNTDTFQHTAWKPILYTDSTYTRSDRSWLHRKFFEEHLLQVQEPGFNIFGDIVLDLYAGGTKRAVPTETANAHESK